VVRIPRAYPLVGIDQVAAAAAPAAWLERIGGVAVAAARDVIAAIAAGERAAAAVAPPARLAAEA
jgi:hypothetical protein